MLKTGLIMVATVSLVIGWCVSETFATGEKKGPCWNAYSDDTQSCFGRQQGDCSGTHWETAVPGKCKNYTGQSTCHEDGITVITIHEVLCAWNPSLGRCEASYTANSQNVQIGNCY